MAPVIHCSAGNIRLFHGTNYIVRNDIHLTKYNASRKYSRLTCYRRLPSPQSSLGLFQISRSGSGSKYRSEIQTVAAVGTDVAVEELSPSVSGDKADETLESPPKPVETTEAPLADSAVNTAPKIKRARPGRKSDMPPVKDEELVVGASFTGKVRSIQPFGAFVDFGAFTDGLVHVSRISEGYVKDIGAVVSIGQEVKVRIVEANMESRRISLTMRDGDDTSKPQQRPDVSSSGSSDKPRPARSNAGRPNQKRGDIQKTSKFVKGQVLDGTVKKLTRSGAFVSLPEGEEGFLPVSEESEGFGNIMGNSSLTVGQEVNVRVLRLTRGVTLTMKKEEDVAGINKQLNQGVVHVATNPFELAFRKNKDIAAFLEEQKKSQKVSENLSTPETSDPKEVGDTLKLDGSTAETGKDQINVSSVSDTLVGDEETTPDDLNESSVSDTLVGDEETTPDELNEETTVDSLSGEPVSNKEEPISSSVMNANAIPEIVPEEGDESETVIKSSSDSVSDELPLPTEAKETDVITTPEPELVSESPSAEKIETSSIEEVATAEEANIDTELSGETSDQVLSSEGVPAEEVASSQPDDILVCDTVVAETPELEETEKSESDSKDEIVNASEIGSSDHGGETKATISPLLVKQLREESGAGMMDCKNALTETDGDIVKAQELLRKKGLASADKKASRATAEGRIGAYIHDNRIGVLIEVNCETDFVARGEIFKELVDDLAMQVAACPQVRYLSTEDVPEEFVKKEREIELQKEDLLTKPEQIRSKIVDGRIKKRLEEFALLEQPYIKNDKMVVKDFVKQTIATIGENINVKRFVRYNLGEGLEKKSQDFAAEVAAQTAAKLSSAAAEDAAPKEQPAAVEVEKAQTVTVTVSAALVKQLRDETGAGMMDCKKALTETGGDLEKAQEYLRKKGLSSADKKSSRLAAEGRISSYIHDSRIGVLIEVNSETDFVARNEKFKEMVDDLAMQVVACPQVEYVSVEDIPESIVSKEKELEMEREDLKSKPEHIREKIVEGRISKRLGELALLEQAFIKDDGVTVKDLVKQTVAALGENMKVRRFVRFTLGEN